MPPKKQDAAAAKAAAVKKAKAIEDKTFGLKNKNKSAKVQNYVSQLEKSAAASRNEKDRRAALADPNSKESRAKRKAEEEARQRELSEIFQTTIKQPKVPTGVDPKSVVCEFFRQGACTKGFKCKFSHDLSVERKSAKIDLFTDRRDAAGGGGPSGGEEGNETMEDWDQDKLERAIEQKHGSHNRNRPTDIICKFFLDAIEKKQFGWFWVCPGGGDECKYRHALPPGYVMQSQIKALAKEAAANKKTIEEEIEEARSAINANTPVTEAVFTAWKKRKVAAKQAAEQQRREERMKAGRLSGRELTELSGFTFEDDMDAGDTSAYAREEDVEAMFAAAAAAAQAAAAAAAAGHGSGGEAGVSDSVAAALAGLEEEDLDVDLDDDELQHLQQGLQDTALTDGDDDDGDGDGEEEGGDEDAEDEDE